MLELSQLRHRPDEEVELGVLLLLEKLTPTERAAFVLREAFDYSYRDISSVLRLEEANARQVVTRARQRLADDKRHAADSAEQGRLLNAFVAAAQSGDVTGLEGLFVFGCRPRSSTPPRSRKAVTSDPGIRSLARGA